MRADETDCKRRNAGWSLWFRTRTERYTLSQTMTNLLSLIPAPPSPAVTACCTQAQQTHLYWRGRFVNSTTTTPFAPSPSPHTHACARAHTHVHTNTHTHTHTHTCARAFNSRLHHSNTTENFLQHYCCLCTVQ